jgi:DNA-binding winged helix-turn-helix (wHTH) protein
VNYLRRKLTAATEAEPAGAAIQTVRGIGYRMARNTGLTAVAHLSTHEHAKAANA